MSDYNGNNNNQNNNGGQAPKREKTILNDPFFWVSTPCPVVGSEGKKSSLRLIIGKQGKIGLNNPHFVVHTGDVNEKDRDTNYGRIEAPFDIHTFGTFMEMFKDIADNPPGPKRITVCKQFVFGQGGKRSDTPVPVANITVGKDELGVVCLSITAKNRPNIVFKLMHSKEFHDFRNADGTPVPDGELSTLFCRGYYKNMTAVMTQLLVDKFIELPPYQPQGGGNGGGGNNYGNNNNGGGQQQQQQRQSSGNSGGGGNQWGDGDIPF